jgi:glucose/arabinose dehydrogenase/plastocyanin
MKRCVAFNMLPLLAACVLAADASAAEFTVNIQDFSFNPATLNIEAGDTVTWVQRDFTAHTTTSSASPAAWRSSLLSEGQTFSHTFSASGSFPYFCEPHPEMRGTIIVAAVQNTPPTVAITSPPNNTELSEPQDVTIEATASATGGTIASVEFLRGNEAVGTDSEAPYAVTTRLETGTHTLTARATDGNGLSSTSAAITVTVLASSAGEQITNAFAIDIQQSDTTIELETVAEGLVAPLGHAAPADISGRLFVYDQAGLVYIIHGGQKLEQPLLDLSSWLVPLRANYDERGLLGLAVHPGFATNGLIYTYTSEPNGRMAEFTLMHADGATNNHQSVIAEWTIDPANTNRVDPASRRELLRIDQPQSNHNGGTIRFGPDGMLYIATGDGGSADDQGLGHSPEGNGQDLNNVLGKILRIDVNTRTSGNGQYGVPSDNPFVGQNGLDEIWAYGFRNPYAFSFDRLNGELLVADVGQNEVEELDLVFKGGNYGWPIKEGSFYFDPAGADPGFIVTDPVRPVPADLIDPIAEYDHDDGLAIVAGFRYHGTQLPHLIGTYIAGDWGSFDGPAGRLFFLDRNQFKEFRLGAGNRPLGYALKGFGEDQQGEIYLMVSTNTGPAGDSGKVLKIVPFRPEIRVADFVPDGTNLTLRVTGTTAPWMVEGKSSLSDVGWRTVTAGEGENVTLAMDDQSGFLRVAEATGNGAIGFTAHLTGAAERPNPVETSGAGSGTFSLRGNTLHFDIRYSGLTAAATMAHIHGPAGANSAAGVLIDLGSFNGGSFGTAGTFSGWVTLTPVQKAHLLAGRTYVNIHTSTNPGGEIRGQIAPVLHTVALSGAAERPNPVTTSGRGSGTVLLVGNRLTFNIAYRDLTTPATMAHIHGPAGALGAAGVLIDLGPFNNGSFGLNGTLNGSVDLTPDQLAHLLEGLLYVNVHSATHPGGEVRGQIRPQAGAVGLTASLSGAAERPNPVTTTAIGLATMSIDGSNLAFQVAYSGLSGAAIGAHIHGPATPAESAGVMINLGDFALGGFGVSGIIAGQVPLTDQQRAAILEGRTYVNIHTPANTGGEIRGQVVPLVLASTLSGAAERATSVQTPAVGTGTWILAGDSLSFNSTYSGLKGAAGAAHIHGPASTSAAAGVLIDLAPFNGGGFGTSGSFAGSITLTPVQLGHVAHRQTYINVHTSEHGGGEIRGQITY